MAAVYVLDSLTQRGKTSWRMSFHPVFDDGSTGERDWQTLPGCSGKRDARKRALAELARLGALSAEEERLEAEGPALRALYLERQTDLMSTGAIEEGTFYSSCQGIARRMGWIGDLPANRIERSDVVSYVSDLREDGYAAKTIAQTLGAIHCALQYAVERGLAERNAAANVKPPKQDPPKPRSLTEDEKFRLLALCDSMEGFLPVAIRLALSTGMRRGEMCALRWSDVDLESGHLRVRHSLGKVKRGAWALKSPKSKASARRLPIEPGLLSQLRKREEAQRRRCEEAGAEFDEGIFVLGDFDGEWLDPDTLHRRFAELAKAFSIAKGECRLHWLRHTFATSMIAKGVDVRTVAAWLGHSDPGFTLRTYVDLDEAAMADSVGTLADSLTPPPGFAAPPSFAKMRICENAEVRNREPERPQPKIIAWSEITRAG